MFVYDAGTIDYCNGMTALKDYINLCFLNRDEPCEYLSYLELQKFLISSFMAVKCTVSHWEGDIRGDNIFISAIPIGDNTTLKLLAFKQDNNGSCFIASEFPLPLDDLKILKLHKDLVSTAMMDYFQESFSLTVQLIDDAQKEIKPQVNVIHMSDIKDLLENTQIKQEEVKEGIKEDSNKFDIKNYQKI